MIEKLGVHDLLPHSWAVTAKKDKLITKKFDIHYVVQTPQKANKSEETKETKK